MIVDCYHSGRFLTPEDLIANHRGPTAPLRQMLFARVSAETIVGRVLRNLVNAYNHAGEAENARFIGELLSALNIENE